MNLINALTMELESHMHTPPPYIILSHRWTSHETTYEQYHDLPAKARQQLLREPNANTQLATSGLAKIHWLGHLVRSMNAKGETPAKHFWIDTCCIDKRSAFELGRSINSMFRWYQRAHLCVAFLQDVLRDDGGKGTTKPFVYSEWFTRGWCLQELLAPTHVLFLDLYWRALGTRTSLSKDISRATGIEERYLQGVESFTDACIAKKMSWLARRATTIKDDMAYCMLGLFNLSMDVRYGEEERAFLRLQEALVSYNDESLFAWTLPAQAASICTPAESFGVLAPWPTCFAYGGRLTTVSGRWKDHAPALVQSRGVRLMLVISQLLMNVKALIAERELPLNCWLDKGVVGAGVGNRTVTIMIQKNKQGVWRRVELGGLGLVRDGEHSSWATPHKQVKGLPVIVPHREVGERDWAMILSEK